MKRANLKRLVLVTTILVGFFVVSFVAMLVHSSDNVANEIGYKFQEYQDTPVSAPKSN